MSNITTLGASEVAVHELEVESELASLGRLRDWFTSLCDTAIEVSDRAWIDSVNLAITEATTNIIRHAYQSRHDQSIKMRVHAGDGQMTIRLLHTGTPFDGPNAIQAPDPLDLLEGGYGLFLLDTIMDSVSYEEFDQMQSITLAKNLPASA